LIKLGCFINNRINPIKWIDTLEKDQDLVDRLEKLNSENAEEVERKYTCRDAQDACLQTLKDHLDFFLQDHPNGSFEQWIKDVHPENVEHETIDHRFYVENSDHRNLWNGCLQNTSELQNYVPVRKNN